MWDKFTVRRKRRLNRRIQTEAEQSAMIEPEEPLQSEQNTKQERRGIIVISKELEEFIATKCIGAKCEVMTERNPLLIYGVMTNFRKESMIMQVEVRGRGQVPQGIIYNSPMWVRMHLKNKGNLIVFGQVDAVGYTFYRIRMNEAVLIPEKREYFRQRLEGMATLRESPNAEPRGCELVDISLSGIAFKANAEYEEGTRLLLTGVHVAEDAEPHDLTCLVRRRVRDDSSGWFTYGCVMPYVDDKAKDRLIRDIFKLQASEISRVMYGNNAKKKRRR